MLSDLTRVHAKTRGRHGLLVHRQTCRRVANDRQARGGAAAAVDDVEPVLAAEARRLDPLVGGQRDAAAAASALDLDLANLGRTPRAQVEAQAICLDALRLTVVIALVLLG